MNTFQIELLKSFLKQYKKGNVSLESIIQHIDCIVDTKKIDTIKLNNKKYESIS
jgi:O-phosphoseryl-tRNA(Cys) synthetase